MDVPLYKVRQFDRYDGWFDVFGPQTMTECMEFIKDKPSKEDYENGYFRIFPSDTVMLNWSYE